MTMCLDRVSRPRVSAAEQNEAGDAPIHIGSPPASTDSGYHACLVGCVGGLGVLPARYGCNPTQGVVVVVRFSE